MALRGLVFETEMGHCGIVWSEQGIAGFELLASDEAACRRALEKRHGALETRRPPAFVREAMRRAALHLAGKVQTYGDLPLDLSGLPPFHRKLCELARKIPAGETVSYGELAEQAGSPGASRAVGQAMAHNRFALLIPCHRVLAAGRGPGGFSAPGGLRTKEKLLAIEGVELRRARGTSSARASGRQSTLRFSRG